MPPVRLPRRVARPGYGAVVLYCAMCAAVPRGAAECDSALQRPQQQRADGESAELSLCANKA